jgi:hypothetical protein
LKKICLHIFLDSQRNEPKSQEDQSVNLNTPVNAILTKRASFKSSSYYKKLDKVAQESEADTTDQNLSQLNILPADSLESHRISPKSDVLDPQFDLRPSDRLIRQGETVRFCCKVNGTRPLEVFWFKLNGDELVNDEKYEINHDDEYYYLKIYNTVQRDSGLYLCVISNDIDQNVDSFYLNIRG